MTKAAFLTAHPHGAACLHELTAATCHIYDHATEQRCYVRAPTEATDTDFIVRLKAGTTAQLAAVDNCVFDRSGGKKCDCLVFTDSTVCFVELKRGSRRNLGRDVRDGVAKMINTLRRFHKDGLLATGDTVRTIVSTKRAALLHPQLTTVYQNARIRLKEEHPDLTVDFQLADEVTL